MKVNQVRAGAILSYASMIVSTAVNLIYTPLLIRYMGKSEYGLYTTVLPIVSYLNLLSLGLGSAYTRYYSRYKSRNDIAGMTKLNGMFLVMFSLIGAVALAVGSLMVFKADLLLGDELTAAELSLGKTLIWIMSVNAAISFPISVYEANVTVNERYVFQKTVNTLKSVLVPICMIPLLLLGFKSVALTMLTLTMTIIFGTVNIIYCKRNLKMRADTKTFDFPLMREMLGFTSFVFISIVVDQMNYSVDKIILIQLYGTEATAVYGAASQLNIYFLSMATVFSGVFIPRVHRMVATDQSDGDITDLFIRVGRIQFIVLSAILLGFVAIGRPFVGYYCGEGYEEAYIISLLLMAPSVIPAIQTLGIEIQRAKNMHKFRSVLYLGIAILNIFVSIPMCRAYGAVGATIGTALSVIVGNGIIMNVYYHKAIKLDIIRFWKQILRFLPSLILPTVLAIFIAVNAEINSVSQMVLWGMVYVAVFGSSMWFLGLNRYEKGLITKPLSDFAAVIKSRAER